MFHYLLFPITGRSRQTLLNIYYLSYVKMSRTGNLFWPKFNLAVATSFSSSNAIRNLLKRFLILFQIGNKHRTKWDGCLSREISPSRTWRRVFRWIPYIDNRTSFKFSYFHFITDERQLLSKAYKILSTNHMQYWRNVCV